jgi:hypothetical protein
LLPKQETKIPKNYFEYFFPHSWSFQTVIVYIGRLIAISFPKIYFYKKLPHYQNQENMLKYRLSQPRQSTDAWFEYLNEKLMNKLVKNTIVYLKS